MVIQKYKNGAVSMVAVMFGTLVMSLICLSFLNQMRSGLSQNVAYTTSMAAYDAAMTGVNDIQLAISECRRNPGTPGSARAVACRTVLGGSDDCRESIKAIERVLWNEERPADRVGLIDEGSNQRYTCMTIEPTTTSYHGVLRSGSDDGVIIPISTNGNERFALLSYGVGMTAPSSANASTTSATNGGTFGFDPNLMNRANEQRSSRNFRNSTTSATDFPTLGFEIAQISSSFRINDLSDNADNTTNTGYLMLAPSSNSTVDSRTTIFNNDTNEQGVRVGLAGSADKANQSPSTVRCRNTAPYPAVNGSEITYNCSVLIELPNPRGGNARDKDHSFIRLTMPFVETDTRFEVSFYEDSSATTPLTLSETQYLVSVQGHTGDRVRRIDANIGGMASNAIVPLWSASVGGTAGVAKCNNGACDSSNGSTNNRLQYTTTYTTRHLNLICEFTWATRDVQGNTPANQPTIAQMNQHCVDRGN